MDRASRETWAKRVERWTDSGLTAKEYAAELGIKAHSLTWWKWRLKLWRWEGKGSSVDLCPMGLDSASPLLRASVDTAAVRRGIGARITGIPRADGMGARTGHLALTSDAARRWLQYAVATASHTLRRHPGRRVGDVRQILRLSADADGVVGAIERAEAARVSPMDRDAVRVCCARLVVAGRVGDAAVNASACSGTDRTAERAPRRVRVARLHGPDDAGAGRPEGTALASSGDARGGGCIIGHVALGIGGRRVGGCVALLQATERTAGIRVRVAVLGSHFLAGVSAQEALSTGGTAGSRAAASRTHREQGSRADESELEGDDNSTCHGDQESTSRAYRTGHLARRKGRPCCAASCRPLTAASPRRPCKGGRRRREQAAIPAGGAPMAEHPYGGQPEGRHARRPAGV